MRSLGAWPRQARARRGRALEGPGKENRLMVASHYLPIVFLAVIDL